MKGISNFFWKTTISIFLLIVCSSLASAKEKGDEKVLYGFSVNVDLLHPLLHLFNQDRMGLNADIQFDLWHKLYPTVVVGYDWYDASDEYAYPIPATNNHYDVNGLYFKIGATYNIWKKDFSKALNPIGYVGMNYGCAPRYKFNIENYPLSDSYWGSQKNNFNATGHTSAHWGEFLLGVRAPVAQNFCLGFEVMLKLFLNIKEQNVNGASIRQTYAPGFGDKETGKWGFRYTVGYFFPTVKSKKRISSDEE